MFQQMIELQILKKFIKAWNNVDDKAFSKLITQATTIDVDQGSSKRLNEILAFFKDQISVKDLMRSKKIKSKKVVAELGFCTDKYAGHPCVMFHLRHTPDSDDFWKAVMIVKCHEKGFIEKVMVFDYYDLEAICIAD
jgi:hypothetical protein